jgi:two-component sensor histidine kinase
MKYPKESDGRADMPGGDEAVRDATERKELEEELANARNENSFLKKELHYRVRNSLQLIESLVKMQLAATLDPCARKALKATEWRLRALSISNRVSLDWRKADEFELSSLMRELTAGLLELDCSLSQGLSVELTGNSARIGMDLLIPIGMMTTEILTKTLGARQGATDVRMEISWSARDDGGFSLRYRDGGGDFPEGLAPKPLETIGMEIIRALAEQIGATVSMVNDGSDTEIRIDFRSML